MHWHTTRLLLLNRLSEYELRKYQFFVDKNGTMVRLPQKYGTVINEICIRILTNALKNKKDFISRMGGEGKHDMFPWI